MSFQRSKASHSSTTNPRGSFVCLQLHPPFQLVPEVADDLKEFLSMYSRTPK